MPKDKDTLTIVVNGQVTEIKVNDRAPLRTVVGKALEETGNAGQPPENWELRDEAGNVLDLGRKIGDFGFSDDAKLFLSLKAGIQG